MREIETDYLVVGAGASGMAFVDTLIEHTDADVVLVDRRARPGGHWLDAYPFVRLHQPSANYGVDSRTLGNNRIDTTGPNAGFYERASSQEICDYFGRVLDEQFIPSGQVKFLGMTDYRGEDADGHRLFHLLDGTDTVVKVRRKFVDATYVESSIPSKHRPAYDVDDDVRCLPPNDLVDLHSAPKGFTVIGCGKTAMDTCNWLLDSGVDPDRITWVRPRDPWLFSRTFMQPLELVASYMELQAAWVKAAAEAETGLDFAQRLEADGVMHRIDTEVEADAFRGATASTREMEALRTITRIVRGVRVKRIEDGCLHTDGGEVANDRGHVYVDCTAAGVRPTAQRPVFAPGRITLQYTTIGIVPWSGATVGFVEAMDTDDEVRNRLCPPLVFTGSIRDALSLSHVGMNAMVARGSDRDVAAWSERSRLNPAAGAIQRMDDARVAAAFGVMATHLEPALANLERRVGATAGAA